jgi:exonuclease SbcC
MRVHSLRMQGFGPFSGTESVDFDALSADGLFIVTGPTGAGKTTVLDAISFALYGQTTAEGQASGLQDGRTGSELRCTGCAPGQTTEVELEFSVGAGRFKVCRNPAYDRAKERGTGRTKEAASAALHQRDAVTCEWSLRSSGKIGTVNAEIERIVGLTAEQFRRVIVIPQGRFREVLLSEHGERQELLQRIFDTNMYEAFEKVVDERARAAESAMREISTRHQQLVGRHPFLQQVDMTRLETLVVERLAEASDVTALAKKDFEARDAARDDAVRGHAQSRDLAAQVAKLQRSRAALAEAIEAAEASMDRRAECERAERAGAPMAAIERYGRVRKACADAVIEASLAQEAVGVARGKLTVAEMDRKSAVEAAAPVPAMTERIGVIRASRASAVTAALQLGAKSKALQQARKAHVAACEERDSADRLVVTRDATLRSTQTALDAVRAAYLRGAAARLVERLEPGCPCPVCGSAEHPNPATPEAEAPGSADLDEAEADLQLNRQSHSDARARAAAAEQCVRSSEAAVKQHETEIAGLPPVEDIGTLDEQMATLDKEIKGLQQAEKSTQAAHDIAVRELNETRLASVRAEENYLQLKRQSDDAAAAFQAALRASGFADEAEVRENARAEAVVKAWRDSHLAQDNAVMTAKVQVTLLEQQVDGRQMPDMPALEAALAAANQLRDQADRKLQEAREVQRVLSDAKRDVSALVLDGEAAERRQRVLSGLRKAVMGELAGGDRVTLHAWVLGAVLEQVVHVATRTMRRLTRGRYELVRAESPTDARSRAGLEIEVFDSHVGTRRAARTLSGGETFLASLSLALALAEVAEMRQGGRRLETVFIDEGFGTLDAETLDLAMDALSAMRKQGRVVGVISHVEEMKRQIGVQLQVRRDLVTGESSTRVVKA